MVTLLSAPIVQQDIKNYLDNYSDFSFELKVLKKLTDFKFKCVHSGTYTDPITQKSREFDIRALLEDKSFRIHLSVECKNIRDNYPLVMHCMKRKKNESYDNLIYSILSPEDARSSSWCEKIDCPQIHRPEEYVAKSSDQVGRSNKGIKAADSDVFDKISQAINSTKDLIEEARQFIQPHITFVCPVLIVPDERLWQVNYSDNGEYEGDPKQVEHVSYYIGKTWTFDDYDILNYKISHMEIMTVSYLKEFTLVLHKHIQEMKAHQKKDGEDSSFARLVRE